MELVGIRIVAVLGHRLEEIGIGVKRACQLMRVAPIDIRLEAVVPFQSLVTVQGISSRNGNISKKRIVCLQFPCNLLEARKIALSPAEVGLIVWRYGDNLMLGIVLVEPFHAGIDKLCPMVGVGDTVLHIVAVNACLLVLIQYDVNISADKVY